MESPVDAYLDIIPEEEDEEGKEVDDDSPHSGAESSGRPMFLKEKGEQKSYIESMNPNLPMYTKDYLIRTFGPFWSSHIINPEAPPTRTIAPDALNLNDKSIKKDAEVVWDAIRLHSLQKLQYRDFLMGPDLRKTFSCYTRQVQYNQQQEPEVQGNKKPLRRFFYWDSITGKDVPMEDIFPSEEKWKPRLEKKKRASEFGHLKSSLNQNMSEMILYNAHPPRYEVEIQTGEGVSSEDDHLKRLLRQADLKEDELLQRLGVSSLEEEKTKIQSNAAKTYRSDESTGRIIFASERQLMSRPQFAEKHRNNSLNNFVFPPKPLVSRVDNSVLVSDRMFSPRHEEVHYLMKDKNFQKQNQHVWRRKSAPSKNMIPAWSPVTMGEVVDSIDISSQKGLSSVAKPLSAK